MNASNEIELDWYEGEDPGMNAWAVVGADGEALVVSDVTGWTMYAYDVTGGPTVAITVNNNGTHGSPVDNSNNFRVFNSLQLDGYWTRDTEGYNVRKYIRAADFTTTPLKAGHSYKFVLELTTRAFDATPTPGWGIITLVRRGSCLARGQ